MMNIGSLSLSERSETTVPVNVVVNNNGTDAVKAAALLRDLEKEAQNKVEAVFQLNDNKFDATITFHRDCMNQSLVAVVLLTLNGQKIRVVEKLDPRYTMDRKAAIGQIVSAVAKEVASTVLVGAFMKMDALSLNMLLSTIGQRRN